jgi:chitin disaccharide deacetylase
LREQLRAEIHAQFRKFHATGLPLDHVNGHLHLHLHPVIFKILMEDAEKLGIRHLRLTRDCFRAQPSHVARPLVLPPFARGDFRNGCPAAPAKPLRQRGIKHAQITFGLLQNARVDEEYVLKLLPELPPGDSELYSHPSLVNLSMNSMPSSVRA